MHQNLILLCKPKLATDIYAHTTIVSHTVLYYTCYHRDLSECGPKITVSPAKHSDEINSRPLG